METDRVSVFSEFKCDNIFHITPYKYDDKHTYTTERVYLTPKRPTMYRFVECHLFRIEQQEEGYRVSRTMIDASRCLEVGISIRRYNSKRQTTDPDLVQSIKFDHRDDIERLSESFDDQSELVTLDTPHPADYSYTVVDIMIMKIDKKINDNSALEEIGKKRKGFTYLYCLGGTIRVYKKALSDEINYFKQLFEGKKKMRYDIDVDIEDMIEVIYCLPPFNRPVRSGLTYGALYRLSYKFQCLKLADLGDNYLTKIKRYAPVIASYIAFEGNVMSEKKLYHYLYDNYEDDALIKKLNKERDIREIESDKWLENGVECDDIFNYIDGICTSYEKCL